MKQLLTTTAFLALVPTWAMAAIVYPGCATPMVAPKHNTFFVDPAKGSNKGDGSAAKPWRVLSEVLFNGTKLVAGPKNPTGPIKPGDIIMLKSGDHGDVKFTGLFNPDFITVMPAPGQTPVVGSLSITSSGKWIFQGLKFMTGITQSKPGGIIAVGYGDWQGPTQDILLDSNTISTVDDTTMWRAADWTTKAQGNGVWTRQGTKCVSITNNHVYNVFSGIGLASSQSVAQGNTIESMANDGIDIVSSDLLIKGNVIRGGTNAADAKFHADGIQGWSPTVNNVEQVNNNVTIDGNRITKFGDPTQTYMQGISIFDGKWNNLTIENNVVAVNHMNAIVLMGVQNSRVLNNTVIGTGPKSFTSWIQIRNSKDGAAPSNTIVRNNIASILSVIGNNMQVDHNIAAASIGIPGNPSITSGTVGNNNKIIPNINDQFAAFNVSTQQADLRPKAGSAASGFGVLAGGALFDITGAARTAPTDAGAYNR